MICPNCHSEFEASSSCPFCGMVMFENDPEKGNIVSQDEEFSKSILLQNQWDELRGKRSKFDAIYKYIVVGLLAIIAILEAGHFILDVF